ncbi:MAG: plasmid partition protein ParG [Terracidiphilus sp.]
MRLEPAGLGWHLSCSCAREPGAGNRTGPGSSGILAIGTQKRISSSPGREVSLISKAKEPEVKRMNLNVPVELHNSFKSVTAAQGKDMTTVLMEFITNYIAKNAPKGRRR